MMSRDKQRWGARERAEFWVCLAGGFVMGWLIVMIWADLTN